MTDFAKLIDWYQSKLDRNVDDLDFENLLDNPESELYQFGIDNSTRPDLAPYQLIPVDRNFSGVADDLMDLEVIKEEIENSGNLMVYSRAIDRGYNSSANLAVGRAVATAEIRDRGFAATEAVEFLQKYSPQSLGGFITARLRETGIRTGI